MRNPDPRPKARGAIAAPPAVLLLALLAAGSPALAAGPAAGPPTLTAGADAVWWQASGAYDRLVLTVSTPDGRVERMEAAGDAQPSFPLFGADGSPVADGVYTWELRAVPAGQVTRGLDGEAGGRRLDRAPAPPAASGTFAVIDGVAVLPGAGGETEPEAGAASASAAGAAGLEPVAGAVLSTGGADPGLAPVAGDAWTPVTAADQIINDDLIVFGRTCTGSSCINNESFGSDTLRLKEVNNRIHFWDTSSPSYPTNDWRITANSSSFGGASYFSIDDVDASRTPFTIRAGAPNNALYVDAAGKLGLGTATPSVELHSVSGDTPTLRLEQDGSLSFTPQIWDVGGNESNFFVRQYEGGETYPFRIRPGAPSSSMLIDDQGRVGIGTASPAEAVHVVRSGDVAFRLTDSSAGGASWLFKNNTANNAFTVTAAAGGGNAPFKVFSATPENTLVVGTAGGAARVGIGKLNPAGTLDVNGPIFQRGGQIHADYVFDPGYSLETIEEHARSMWERRHLPALAPAAVDEQGLEVVEIGAQRRGMLEELEVAHVYIEQLHGRIEALDAQLADRDAQLATVLDRLERLEKAAGVQEE